MQQINYNYKNYRAALLCKDSKDYECNFDTYISSPMEKILKLLLLLLKRIQVQNL